MSVMVIELGYTDQPREGNVDLPFYEEVRLGLKIIDETPEVYCTRTGTNLPRDIPEKNPLPYEFRTTWKEAHLRFGRMTEVLKYMLAVMLRYTLHKPGIDGVMLTQGKRRSIYVSMTRTAEELYIFHFSPGH